MLAQRSGYHQPPGRAVKGISAHGESMRLKCANGNTLTRTFLGQRHSRALILGLVKILQPYERRHLDSVTRFKTRAGRKRWLLSQCSDEKLEYRLEIMGWMDDLDLLIGVGAKVWNYAARCSLLHVVVADMVVESLFMFTLHLLTPDFGFTESYSEHVPGAAFEQLNSSPEVRMQGMQQLQSLGTRFVASDHQQCLLGDQTEL